MTNKEKQDKQTEKKTDRQKIIIRQRINRQKDGQTEKRKKVLNISQQQFNEKRLTEHFTPMRNKFIKELS